MPRPSGWPTLHTVRYGRVRLGVHVMIYPPIFDTTGFEPLDLLNSLSTSHGEKNKQTHTQTLGVFFFSFCRSSSVAYHSVAADSNRTV